MPFLSSQSGDLISLFLALAVGLIIGFERGWHGQDPDAEGGSVGGIRTFSLVGLLGGVMAMVAADTRPVILPAGLLVLGAILVASYLLTSGRTRDYGATTEVALLLAFMLGAMAVTGYHLEAVSAAVVTAFLLGFKAEIHSILEKLDRRELQSSLQLLVIALVILPLLPDRAMGPWNSLNPRVLGLLVMLIAGIGFVGYFSIRMLGARAGLLLTSVLGGLTSSTAVTVAFSRLARSSGRRHALLGAGITLACAAMVPRVLVELAAVNSALVPLVLPPLAMLATVPLLATAWIARRHPAKGQSDAVGISNPLEIGQALIIGGFLALVFMLSHAARAWLGETGLYWVAALSGLVNVDAITLAVAQQARGDLSDQTAAHAIVLAAFANTLFKAGFAAIIGGRVLARWAGGILILSLVASTATLAVV